MIRHSLWFIPLLVLSVALKFYGSAVPSENPATILRNASATLQNEGFIVKVDQIGYGRLTVQRAECVAQLRIMDPHGTQNNFYRTRLKPNDIIRYAWRGTWNDRRPAIQPLLEYYVKRELARRGLSVDRTPVWIVGIGERCRPSISAKFSRLTLSMKSLAK